MAFSGLWEHNAYLSAPLQARLPSNIPQQFTLTVPGAETVYVKSADQRLVLQGQAGQFTGSITAAPGELVLFAVFPGHAESVGLLKYQVE